MAKLWRALLCSFLTEDVGAESHVRKHHSVEELAVDDSAELSNNSLDSVSKLPASLVREARRPKRIEVDAFGIARTSDNFVDSTHVLVRDAKERKSVEVDSHGDVKTIDDFAFSAPNLSSIVVRKALDEQVTAAATSETKHEAMKEVDVLNKLEAMKEVDVLKKAGGGRRRRRRFIKHVVKHVVKQGIHVVKHGIQHVKKILWQVAKGVWQTLHRAACEVHRNVSLMEHCCLCRDKIKESGWCVSETNLDFMSQKPRNGFLSCFICRCGQSDADLLKMCRDESLLCKDNCDRYEETFSGMCRDFDQASSCKAKGDHLRSNRMKGGQGNGGTCWYDCCTYERSSLVEAADSNRPSLLKSRASIPISNDSKQPPAVSLHETQVEELDESVQRKCR